jgi:hypothetical protein
MQIASATGSMRLLAALLLVGCYSPSVPQGLPCSDAGRCPEGQECMPDGICRSGGQDGTPGPDAACAPASRLVQVGDTVSRDAPAANDSQGIAMARSGPWLALGMPRNSTIEADAGAVVMFELDAGAWTERAILTASDGAAGDKFGESVAIDGGVLVVGAPVAGDADQGSAYVFHEDGGAWTEVAILASPTGLAGDRFGKAVAVHGDHAAVGAPSEGDGTGALYLFQRDGDTWPANGDFVPSDQTAEFGAALAMNTGFLAVGSPGDDDRGDTSGSVFLLARDGESWGSGGKVLASDGVEFDNFGFSVDLSEDRLAVGAYQREDRGAVYVYTESGGEFGDETLLVGSGTSAADQLGYAVTIDGDLVAAGATADDDVANSAGTVYVFGRDGDGWSEGPKVTDEDGGEFDLFGYTLDLDGEELLVGSPLAEANPGEGAQNTGEVHAHALPCP